MNCEDINFADFYKAPDTNTGPNLCDFNVPRSHSSITQIEKIFSDVCAQKVSLSPVLPDSFNPRLKIFIYSVGKASCPSVVLLGGQKNIWFIVGRMSWERS
jgi:hypothetical protein